MRFLWFLNLSGAALVVGRLYFLGLHKTYRFFIASMVLSLLRSAALFPFSPTDPAYYRIWAATQPLIWLSYVLVVLELYRLTLGEYKGIYSLSLWFFYGGLVVSLTISALTVLPTMSGPPAAFPLRYYYALAQRGFVTSLAFLLLLLMALVAWFAVPLSRNLLMHCSIYAAYFFTSNVIFLFWHLGPKANNYWSSVLQLLFAFLCCLSWVFFLTRRGEDRITSLRLKSDPLKERQLVDQLASLNATLLLTAKK